MSEENLNENLLAGDKSISCSKVEQKHLNVMVLSAAGFIGTNLVFNLAGNTKNQLTLVDTKIEHSKHIIDKGLNNVRCIEDQLSIDTNFDVLTMGQDIVYHLMSTTAPITSNQHISQEMLNNVVVSSKLLDACVRNRVRKVVFLSSGGTVYGKNVNCPIAEDSPTNPISSYGVQKITIEKLLYLYNYMYGLDYRVIRLSNPYGPYQRPNGRLGVVTTFTYKALKHEPIVVYGDGSVVRDFIYIDDAIKGISSIVDGENEYKTFNLGCGYGTSITELIDIISETLKIPINVTYMPARKVDVPVNYLNIRRYESEFGQLNPISLSEGIKKTADFMSYQKMV